MEKCCQEPPNTWRMSSFLLSLIMVLMAGVTFTEPEVTVDVEAGVPDADHDGWGHLH